MSQRITGLETEYGCLIQPPAQPQDVLPRIRDWLFENDRYGLIDLHDRDWDEPAGNGGFLFNGGRIYIDMGHMEYCTPECASASDVVRYDRAGDLLAVVDVGRAGGLQLGDGLVGVGGDLVEEALQQLLALGWALDFRERRGQRAASRLNGLLEWADRLADAQRRALRRIQGCADRDRSGG